MTEQVSKTDDFLESIARKTSVSKKNSEEKERQKVVGSSHHDDLGFGDIHKEKKNVHVATHVTPSLDRKLNNKRREYQSAIGKDISKSEFVGRILEMYLAGDLVKK